MGLGSENCSPKSLVEAEAAAPGLPPEQQVAWPGPALSVHRGPEAMGVPGSWATSLMMPVTRPPTFFLPLHQLLIFLQPGNMTTLKMILR